ncbi:hypothetical protein [uncultured Jatrophihabitans sp.]|uniref:hypothetical protein n=1 Tax=uncultured Jatrophihabitans sp. TaxID=1610747 RepID=UPI0035CB5BE0
MFTLGKKDVAYQKHVIVGFSTAENPKYNLDLDRLVAGHGQRIIADLPEPEDAFVRILAAAEAKA